ncbi:retrovirus-related Pol polyprotein from transposon 297 [Trichonephila clavipes]|nr:retrovirus-related Pol polyprotein from transposon 297 [Trichonephila clavipes]
MAEDSKNLTFFKTHWQQYRFKGTSFGLKNASATFQREINKALSYYREFSRAYIDDIAIFSKNLEEHLHLDIILTKLKVSFSSFFLKECAFGKTQIKCLGHIIGSGKHEPDSKKTAVINDLPVPTTKKELRSVLGLCNYYREYIPKYSVLVYPMTELTKKRVPDSLPWTEKHDSLFHLLKKALVEAPSLYSPVPDKLYTIHSDASQIGIGACLSQKCDDKCYPIAYASKIEQDPAVLVNY